MQRKDKVIAGARKVYFDGAATRQGEARRGDSRVGEQFWRGIQGFRWGMGWIRLGATNETEFVR